MRVCLFDDVVGGHHGPFVTGLARAAADAGHAVYVATPERADIPGLPSGQWLQVPATTHREVLKGRRTTQSVIRWATEAGSDVILDLYLDKTIWTWKPKADTPPTVHVLHHAHHYLPGGNSIRTGLARNRLRTWIDRGDRVAVHTPSAAEILSRFLPAESIVVAGYPARPPAAVAPRATHVSGPPRLLFVGQARREKGAHVFLDALCRLTSPVTVTVAGPQTQAQRRELEAVALPCPVTWVDKHLDTSELQDQFAAADLVILPYLNDFAAHGGASGVLIDTLANGRPMVTTDALADQLPEGYGGAVVVPAGDAEALAAGIERALTTLSDMQSSALAEGLEFVHAHHSFASYLADLLGHD